MDSRDANAPILATLVDEPKTHAQHGEGFWALVIVTFLVTLTVGTGAIVIWRERQAAKDETAKREQEAQASATTAREELSVDDRVVQLLAQGEQSEAEALLEQQITQLPEALKLSQLLVTGKKSEAERYLRKNLQKLRAAQRTLFLFAACKRSRFDIPAAFLIFTPVVAIESASPSGRCAAKVLLLDGSKLRAADSTLVDRAFAEFHELVDANPDDVMIRWMLAVECRHWNRNVEGAWQYKKMLEQWDPGPALVHQTYANLLDNLGRYKQSLEERRKVVTMEPSHWSYDGLANTLTHLRRYKEANEAHAKAVELEPESSSHWTNWAVSLNNEGDHVAAIEKCERALALDDANWRAWWMWGKALDAQGDPRAALEKYRRALKENPGATFLQGLIVEAQNNARKQPATPSQLTGSKAQ